MSEEKQVVTTVLFNQQGIKAMKHSEGVLSVYFVDGNDPMYINSDDEMYKFYLKDFNVHVGKAHADLEKSSQPSEEKKEGLKIAGDVPVE